MGQAANESCTRFRADVNFSHTHRGSVARVHSGIESLLTIWAAVNAAEFHLSEAATRKTTRPETIFVATTVLGARVGKFRSGRAHERENQENLTRLAPLAHKYLL